MEGKENHDSLAWQTKPTSSATSSCSCQTTTPQNKTKLHPGKDSPVFLVGTRETKAWFNKNKNKQSHLEQ